MSDKSETKNYKIGDLLACFNEEEDRTPILGMITSVVKEWDYDEDKERKHYYVLWVDEVIQFHYYDVSAFEQVLNDTLNGYVEEYQDRQCLPPNLSQCLKPIIKPILHQSSNQSSNQITHNVLHQIL